MFSPNGIEDIPTLMITWYLEPIQSHIDKIKELFAKNADHKLASNYLEMSFPTYKIC